MKTCGLLAGYSLLGFNVAKEAMASAMDFVGLRQKSVYDADAKIYKIRKSQDNPMIKKLYDHKEGFLHEGPCGHMSHQLLHTHYIDRSANVAALKAHGVKLHF
jgi:ferredoxin hydrogenase small subunit